MPNTALRRIQVGLKRMPNSAPMRFPSYGGTGMGYGDGWGLDGFGRGQNKSFDYQTEAGLLWECAVVFALIRWQAQQINQAPLVVKRKYVNGKENIIDRHPLAELIANPNPHWTSAEMWGLTLLNMSVAGNPYWIKRRAAAMNPVELWGAPLNTVTPMWESDGREYISKYRYRVSGYEDVFYDPSEIVHFRSGLLNPLNYRLALSLFNAGLKDICTENGSATYTAAFNRNGGVPKLFISPKDKPDSVENEGLFKKLKAFWSQEFGGENAGSVYGSSLPIDIVFPQVSPDNMAMSETRALAVSRICSVFGVDPMVIGLSSEQKTYSNFEEANRAAWDHNIIPTQQAIAATLTRQLLPDMGNPLTEECAFDNTNVPALQEDKDLLWTRHLKALHERGITQNEFRVAVGFAPSTEASADILPPLPVTGSSSSGDGSDNTDTTGKPKA